MTNDKWIEIDLEAVTGNLQAVKNIVKAEVRLIAVVKANAYGHGACATAHLLAQQGVKYFAVSFLEEARQLRKSGLTCPVMLFSPLPTETQVVEAIEDDLTLTIASPYDARLVSQTCTRLNRPVTIHLKVDSGLGRFGMEGPELIEAWEILKKNPYVQIEGIYTHMAQAASNPGYTEQQYERFKQAIAVLEQAGGFIPVKHCANSAVLLKYPHMQMDAVRVGTLLSGQAPAGTAHFDLHLRDPYKYKCRIISLRRLKAGSRLGYYSTYRLKREAWVAVIPVGFNDGLALEVANKPAGFIDMLKHLIKTVLAYLNFPRYNLYVNIKGHSYPVRGKVFMQMALIELPADTEVQIGDEVEVPIRKTIASSGLLRVYTRAQAPVKAEELYYPRNM